MIAAKSKLILGLVHLADSFCAASGQSRASVSKLIFARGSHLDDLETGRRDLATGTFERAVGWFSDNWPADAEWPADVPRPIAEAAA